eukprot:420344-Prorocentrum_minimum.AAC.2
MRSLGPPRDASCLPSCDRFSRGAYTASPLAIGSHAAHILPPLLRLVLTRSIYCLPSCDWFSRGVSRLAFESRRWCARCYCRTWVFCWSSSARAWCRYILPPLVRLVLTRSIYCLPSCDWFSRGAYTASPLVIGSHAEHIYCLPSCD